MSAVPCCDLALTGPAHSCCSSQRTHLQPLPSPQACAGKGPHLNSELLPLPLGPVTSRLVPEGTRRVRSCTSVAPVGVTTLALSKEISLLAASTVPCACVAPRWADPVSRNVQAHELWIWVKSMIRAPMLLCGCSMCMLHGSEVSSG